MLRLLSLNDRGRDGSIVWDSAVAGVQFEVSVERNVRGARIFMMSGHRKATGIPESIRKQVKATNKLCPAP